MLGRLLSHDLPRSRALALVLLAIVVALALAPFVFPGSKAIGVAAKMLVFVLLVASYDLLLGYTGIVSFAHTMFFGIGAYGIAIASTRLGAGWGAAAIGLAAALALSLGLSLVIGLFSLRVKAIFYAMITLAVVAVLFPALLRIVNSPFGRVLQAIRENDFRAEAIGYRTVVFRTLSNVIGALFATVAGALLALWLRYTGPDTTLSFEIMLDILLIVVIGGMGTMYGAIIGAVLFMLAQNYLQNLLALAGSAVAGVPVLGQLISADRWLLWLGLLFVLSVYHFPAGVVGRLRAFAIGKPNA